MIVSEKKAQEAWDTLRTWARLVDEKWDADELARVLGRSEADLKDAYRAACRHAHPDMGGRMEDFVVVDRAKHIVAGWIEKAAVTQSPELRHGGDAPCSRCNGKGTITLRKGFGTMPASCPTCRGSGQLIEQEKTADGR